EVYLVITNSSGTFKIPYVLPQKNLVQLQNLPNAGMGKFTALGNGRAGAGDVESSPTVSPTPFQNLLPPPQNPTSEASVVLNTSAVTPEVIHIKRTIYKPVEALNVKQPPVVNEVQKEEDGKKCGTLCRIAKRAKSRLSLIG